MRGPLPPRLRLALWSVIGALLSWGVLLLGDGWRHFPHPNQCDPGQTCTLMLRTPPRSYWVDAYYLAIGAAAGAILLTLVVLLERRAAARSTHL